MKRVHRFSAALALLVMAGGHAFAQQTCRANIPDSTPTAQFTDHGDGTVTDGKTGLMWKRCAEAQTWSGGTCTGQALGYTWQQALQLAKALNDGGGFAGKTGWRVPNIKELQSIVEERCHSPSINATLFPNTPLLYFWSASIIAFDPSSAWSVVFGNGNAYQFSMKRNGAQVRLVRAGQSFDSFDAANIPRLGNISTRMQVLTGNDVMIGGFVIGGATPKTVVVRARGPSLIPFGIANALANPTLQLFSGQTVLATNDDWGSASNAAAIAASGFAPDNALESAILATLSPGAYTAIVSGVGNTTGVGIVEVFEVDHPEIPLANISTRGQVLTNNDVMIGGFIISGTSPQTVVVRARGPSLIPFGITNALANPKLDLYSGSTLVASNDDWGSAANAAQITASGFAPGNALESAILITLNPGAYTAIVTGAGGVTGVGIVEVFAQ